MEETETETHLGNCLNCGTPLTDRFCTHCGQDSKEFKRSVWSMFIQFLETFTDFDNKLISSLFPLLFRPGFLTRQYLNGKRKSFLNPIQMYAFFSFLFFLTFFYLPDFQDDKTIKKDNATMMDSLKRGLNKEFGSNDSLDRDSGLTFYAANEKIRFSNFDEKKGFEINGRHYRSVAQYDSLETLKPVDQRAGWLLSGLYKKLIRLNGRLTDDKNSITDGIKENFKQNFPNLIIFLLPFFALILKLIYIRREYFYVEHLIFSIHLHCFSFILLSFVILFSRVCILIEDIYSLAFLGILIYAFCAMLFFYKQSKRKTFIKFNILGASYTLFLVIGVCLNLLLSLLLLD